MSIPCLHSPVVITSVPSMSIVARSKNSAGCLAQTFSRASLMASIKRADVRFGEAAAEVARRGRVGNPLGAQGVEEDLVVAAQLDVLQPDAVAQRVVGQVQHVVRLVVGQMDLQQVQAAVDGLDQPGLAGQGCITPMPPVPMPRTLSAIS